MGKYKVVTCSTLSEAEAEKIAELLLDKNLTPCVQITKIKSRFKWKGLKERNDGFLLMIKTRADKYKDIETVIKANHSFKKPEIIELDVSNIHPLYAGWIDESVK